MYNNDWNMNDILFCYVVIFLFKTSLMVIDYYFIFIVQGFLLCFSICNLFQIVILSIYKIHDLNYIFNIFNNRNIDDIDHNNNNNIDNDIANKNKNKNKNKNLLIATISVFFHFHGFSHNTNSSINLMLIVEHCQSAYIGRGMETIQWCHACQHCNICNINDNTLLLQLVYISQ